MLSDDFTGTTISTAKWTEVDTGGSGGTSGNIQQNGTLTTANGYVGGVWGTNALISADTFDSSGLEVSAVMTNNSDQLLGYGDYNFQSAGTKAYILDMAGSSIYTLVWNNGALVNSNFTCGTFTDGATYKIKVTAGGFEAYKNGVLQCTQSTAVSIDDEKVFLQSSASASVFDDVLVTGTAAGPTAPGAPTGVSTTAGDTQIAVSWTAPASDGGSALIDYVVEYKLSSEPTTWTTFSDGVSTGVSATITGLTNDLAYDVRVSAVNGVGTGDASATSSATPTEPTVPDAPTSLSGISGNNQVSLSWTAPADNGGSAITDYLVEYKLSSDGSWSTFADGTSSNTTATVTGLTNDLVYNFRVSAVNAIGTSTASGTANATPGEELPLTISNLALWLDGSDVANMTESGGLVSQVNDKSGNSKHGTASGSVRPTLASGAQNGRSVMRFDGSDDYLNINSSVTYRTIFVVAKSDDTIFSNYPGIVGDYTGTSPSNGHVVNGVDGTTKIANATSNYTSAYRNGTLIAGSSGHDFAPLNEYWIGSFTLSSNMTNTTSAIGMINGGGRYWDGDIAEVIAYSTTLSADNRALVESYLSTKWGIAVEGPTAPDAPTSLTASKGNTQISLSWTAPADNGGSAITDYLVEYKLSSDGSWSTFADGTSSNTTATVTGLTNDLVYNFRVSAINAFGTSVVSSTATKTPGAPTAPDAPTIGTATTGNTQASVDFTAPADNGGSVVTLYTITASPGGATATGTEAPIVVTGLTNGVEYTFTVTATNAIGTSVASAASNTVTPSEVGNQLTDSFTGSAINTTKWAEVDPTGKGGSAGKVTQSGTLSIADSYSGGYWGATALVSHDSFSASSLEISAVINTASSPLIGYGDYLFGVSGNKAYLLYAQHGSTVLALSWDGASSSQTSCGTATSGATFKMKLISGGFEVYKNGALQCTHNTAVSVDNKPVFLQTSAAASTFDDVVVYGVKTSAVLPGQVTGLTATGVNKQALLNWDTPASNGYAAITDYTVEYKLSTSGTWSTFADGTSQNTKTTVTGLTNGASYDFRVSAVNSAGAGTPSATTSATPAAPNALAFVITGESNSGGIGLNSDATVGELAARPSVQIMNLTSGDFLFEDLDIGTNNLRDHAGLEGYYTSSHGLELQLANSVEAHTFPDYEQVYLTKTGHGGSQVSQWNVGGTYWTKFLQRTAAAKAQLPEDPTWVVWMSLGINDAIAGTALSTWKSAMVAHINKIKADLPDAIIVLTQFQAMSSQQSGYATYNAIMSDIASEEANVYVVDSTGAGLRDANHWSYAGFKTLGVAMASTTRVALGLVYPGAPTSLVATGGDNQAPLSWQAPSGNGGASITDYLIEYKAAGDSSFSTFADGVSVGTSATVTGLGSATGYTFRVSALSAYGAGTATTASATTNDTDGPTISSIATSTTATRATVEWTTNEPATSLVQFSPISGTFIASTTLDATLVTTHSVTIDELRSCTRYYVRIRSADAEGNVTYSSVQTFKTLGCTGGASAVQEGVTEVTSSGGSASLMDSGKGIQLQVPAGFKVGVGASYFQLKKLDPSAVLGSASTPVGRTLAGGHMYNLASLPNSTTTISTFDAALTVTMTYDDADIAGLDEASLRIYRYDGTSWYETSGCTVDAAANTVTCTTTQFSDFGLFGGAPSSQGATATASVSGNGPVFSGSASALPGYKAPRLQRVFPDGRVEYLTEPLKSVLVSKVSTGPAFSRDLEPGMKGEDVRELQRFLNANGHVVATAGPGSPGNETDYYGAATKRAVAECQSAHGVTPATGVVGPKTRALIGGKLLEKPEDAASHTVHTLFTQPLRLGMTHASVKLLQQVLNMSSDTVIAQSGEGSPGFETDFFGEKTRDAVRRFQLKHGIATASDVSFGVVGPKTRETLNRLLVR